MMISQMLLMTSLPWKPLVKSQNQEGYFSLLSQARKFAYYSEGEQRKTRLKTIKIIGKKVLSTSNLNQFVSSNSKKFTSKKSTGQTHRFITRDSTPDECIILD